MSPHTVELLKTLVTDLYIGGKPVPATGGRRVHDVEATTSCGRNRFAPDVEVGHEGFEEFYGVGAHEG